MRALGEFVEEARAPTTSSRDGELVPESTVTVRWSQPNTKEFKMPGVFWNYGSHVPHAIHSTASEAKTRALNVGYEVRRLELRIDALALKCEALWELLRENAQLSDDQILTKIDEIDLRDGELDKKVRHSPFPCPSCGRPATKRRGICIYCERPFEDTGIFT